MIRDLLREFELESNGCVWIEHKIYAKHERYVLCVPELNMYPEFDTLEQMEGMVDRLREAIKLRKRIKELGV